ncbi:hypothetical protein FY534_13375 [Alicyclobacillus sp. TC]|uniref:tyrosine-protein phosphatase n=1 Tax=Alicyclobacillus sp. TC TaxID=2606450 RepID=UPI0019344064|nr:CpsB/CapC family capsule biosynthesis tyrosine phosphatase [Alicyclobacillus sp. TC]QRF24503.1 hypothetical protein FY534_13375 [Alicyclobacillus sp. TC]
MYKHYTITDIHTHVLPNLDDGPENMEETEHLLTAMHAVGVDRIFCTSHYLSPSFEVSLQQMTSAYDLLQSTPQKSAWPAIQLGAEMRVHLQQLERLKDSDWPRLGDTHYILLELPNLGLAQTTLQFVKRVTSAGLHPIIAHPERLVELQKSFDLVDQLLATGASFQLTASCFIPSAKADRPVNRLAWTLLETGYASVIASDSHNTNARPPALVAAYQGIEERFGEKAVIQLIENANKIWQDDEISRVAVR